MEPFEQVLNDILVDTFRDLLKVEEGMLKNAKSPISISEIHLLESVGSGENRTKTVSEIAADLNITLASVTIAVGKLVGKGFLRKVQNPNDRRSVYISLTKEGERIFRMHRYFHQKMVRAMSDQLDEREKQILADSLLKLDRFFREKSQTLED